jgi:DNA-directed RNA polymerase III subunit RPC6
MSTMASSAQDVKMEGDAPTPVDPAKADLLYDKCDKEPPGTVFFQRDLTNMGVAEDLAELVRLINDLEARHLFKTMRFDEEPCWKLRSRDDAEKYDLVMCLHAV